MELKPGWKTSEFWLAVLSQTPAVLGIFLGASNPVTIAVGAVVSLGYIASRAHAKGNATTIALAAIQGAAKAASDASIP